MTENASAKPLILLVDDDERLRLPTRAVLEQTGFAVIEAAGGAEEIMEEVQREHFCVLAAMSEAEAAILEEASD